ncbi:MAG TPA: penicillin acylase family protein [Mycobacteriales bacterium]|nr:penicillin acylase family protein [Mycobacteriales bacterium]
MRDIVDASGAGGRASLRLWPRSLAVASLSLLLLAAGAPALAAPPGGSDGPTQTGDRLRASNVVPPGESGFLSTAQFAATTAGTPGASYGPHVQDQLGLYTSWQYKPFQMEAPVGARPESSPGTPPPGDDHVKIQRDSWGVPLITADTDADAAYGIGYAMAQDRLFQLEAFRHVGHGTLAALVGPSGIVMDEDVRRLSEGSAALMQEFSALPAATRLRIQRFSDGINARIAEVNGSPSEIPAEFLLLGDVHLPNVLIAPWTLSDTLGFGEYAARYFGEFGHDELDAMQIYLRMVGKVGQPAAEKAFEALEPLDDPHAPTSIAKADGTFPRHRGTAISTTFKGSAYANHDPAVLPSLADATAAAHAVNAEQSAVQDAQRLLALPRLGSNSVVVSGKLTKDGHPMLYGGPQTGWSIPGYFWEAEVHAPGRDQRGVMVPGIPLFVIGRNATAAWTVTSALDANADTFIEQLDPTDSTYVHDGQTLPVEKHTEVIQCSTAALISGLPGITGGSVPQTCPTQPTTITVYRTIHGPAIADPTADHQLFVRDSAVDHHLLQSIVAWDQAGLQTTPASFAKAISQMTVGFNMSYVDASGHIGYWHVGRYPIRAKNADETLPMPGTGAYDWQGFEKFGDQPHVVDPKAGFVANWNNKPAVGWYSKEQLGVEVGGRWGDSWEVVPLQDDIKKRVPLDFVSLGQVPRDVAYTDDAARLFKPTLIQALSGTADPRLATVRTALIHWNGERDVRAPGSTTKYGTPAVVFFDRFVEHLMVDALAPLIGADAAQHELVRDCTTPPCHLVSVDNEDAATYKFELPIEQSVLASLNKHPGPYDYLKAIGGPKAAFARAATEAADEITAAQGSDAAAWDEPVETGEWVPQGALSVPALNPLPNRGSYGQVIEALAPVKQPTGKPVTSPTTPHPPHGSLAATGATGALGWFALALVGGAMWVRRLSSGRRQHRRLR